MNVPVEGVVFSRYIELRPDPANDGVSLMRYNGEIAVGDEGNEVYDCGDGGGERENSFSEEGALLLPL